IITIALGLAAAAYLAMVIIVASGD
ncbi:MAG: hypothetical protein H6Q77_2695, partial [Gemmatimonadetes bacterium]|nr:hypothetical protein [Gemmatimonadota bacterium]MBP2649071.1 hypothetical protein [Gemmatimonadota bacterium]